MSLGLNFKHDSSTLCVVQLDKARLCSIIHELVSSFIFDFQQFMPYGCALYSGVFGLMHEIKPLKGGLT
jgi:hypothetical protein